MGAANNTFRPSHGSGTGSCPRACPNESRVLPAIVNLPSTFRCWPYQVDVLMDIHGIPHQHAIHKLGVDEGVSLRVGFGVDLESIVVGIRRAGRVAEDRPDLILMHPFLQAVGEDGSTALYGRRRGS